MGELLTSGFPIAAAEAEETVSTLGTFLYIGLTLLILFLLLNAAKKGLNQRVFKNPLTSCFEQLYLFIEGMCVGIIGSHGRKYVPMMMTIWMVIFFGNLVALVMPYSPTADISFNVALALISVGYVQWEGIKANGPLGHMSHFAGPKLGGIMALLITPVIFSVEIVSEIMKNVSLSLRLYGNIHGGHKAVEAMNVLGKTIYVPWGEFLLPIKLLTVVVQALIFTLLTCVYLSLVTAHHEEHGEEHGHDHAAVAA